MLFVCCFLNKQSRSCVHVACVHVLCSIFFSSFSLLLTFGSPITDEEVVNLLRVAGSTKQQKALIERAFGGDDLSRKEFDNEKNAIIDEDDPDRKDSGMVGWVGFHVAFLCREYLCVYVLV
jgi:Utp14 protein